MTRVRDFPQVRAPALVDLRGVTRGLGAGDRLPRGVSEPAASALPAHA